MQTTQPSTAELSNSQKQSRTGLLILLIAVLGFSAAILYWPTIHLPLLYDDLLHIRITKGLNWSSVWLPTDAFGFYRPLTFVPLLAIDQLLGRYPAELLHGINVFQHVANVILISTLSWRLWHKFHWVAATGLLLAFYPFSYQAIAVYGHNVHPATAGILILGLHTYLSALRSTRRQALWWLATAIFFLLGLMSHESAILFGAFAALIDWNEAGHLPSLKPENLGQSVRKALNRPWFIFLIFGFLYFIVYQFLPLSRAPQASFAGGDLWFKALYVIQAAAYPIARLAGFFSEGIDAAVGIVLVGLSVLLGLTWWSAKKQTNRLPLLTGWAWWGLSALVVALPLETSYLLHGPRLLYLGSVGLAILWPVLLDPVFLWPKAGPWIWAALLAFILVTSGLFVRDRLAAYVQLTSPVEVVRSTMDGKAEEEGILLINLPDWLAPQQNTYPIGVEFVAMLGNYLFAEELMTQNLGVDRPVQSLEVPDLLTEQAYSYDIHEQGTKPLVDGDWSPGGSHVFIVSYDESGPQTRYAGQLTNQEGQADPIATFGPYDLLAGDASYCEASVKLITIWYAAVVPEPTTSIFAQLLDGDGRLIAQADGPPLGLRPDLIDLPQGWVIVDQRTLLADDVTPESVLLGAYDYVSGGRYPAIDDDGQALPDHALRIEIKECPANAE